MKRQKPKRKPRQKKQVPGPGGDKISKSKPGRRDVLSLMRNWGLVAVVAAGGGWYLIDEVAATIAEQDLTKIGNGIPTVVQIHDPQCPKCQQLQREARKAMKGFDDDELQFLVANIKSSKGHALAISHGVRHITLLLLDGQGKQTQVLHGNREANHLKDVFQAHVAKFAGAPKQ